MSQPLHDKKSQGGVTLDDVARLAGVSTATVSRALNHPEQVAPKSRQKIETAIAQTGYVPNLLAGGLASRRSRLIAAIVHSIENPVHAETIKHFSRTLRRHGYQVILGETDYQEHLEEEMVAAMLGRRPDGIFLTGSNHTQACLRMLLAANIPVVEAWNLTPQPFDVGIGFSYEKIGRAMGEYVLNKGYQNIVMASADDHRSELRGRACREYIRERTGGEPHWIRTASPTHFAQGRELLTTLMNQGIHSGAIICSTDILAHGLLTEATARNIAVPGQFAVMGFGDLPFAAHTHPPLTTVRFDREVIGCRAAELLLQRINNDDLAQRVIDVGFEIIGRQTL